MGSLSAGNFNTGQPTGGTGTASALNNNNYSQAPAPAMSQPQPASARAPEAPTGAGYQAQSADVGWHRPAQSQSSSTNYQMPAYKPPPPPQQYQAYNPQSSPVAEDLRELSEAGSDLMDPNSDYYKELVSGMRQDIGRSTAASKRSAALEGAEQGFGAGASPEMMENMQMIGESGRIAEGNAMGDITLAAPQIGAGMMASTFAPGTQLQGIGEQSGQFGAGLQESGTMNRAGMAEGARQFEGGIGLQQQGMADERAYRDANMQNENQRWEAEFGQREDQLAAEYGAYDDGYGASGYGGRATGRAY